MIVLLLTCLSLSACGTDQETPRDDSATDDPAMLDVTDPTNDGATNPATASLVPTEPRIPQFPTRKNGRVFFPELGWMDEAAFLDMYHNTPEKLPASLDLEAAHHLLEAVERDEMTKDDS